MARCVQYTSRWWHEAALNPAASTCSVHVGDTRHACDVELCCKCSPAAVCRPLIHEHTCRRRCAVKACAAGCFVAACVGLLSRYYVLQNSFSAAGRSLLLSRSLRVRLWDDSSCAVRQLPSVGKLLGARLAAAGLGSLRALATCNNAHQVEVAAQK